GLLGRCTTIDDEFTASDKRRLIGGKIQHAIGDICGRASSAKWDTPQPLFPSSGITQDIAHHLSVNRTRMHRVAADLVFGVLDGGRLGKESYRAFRGGVRRGAIGTSDQSGCRGDVDDGAATRLPHSGDGVLRPEEDALDIDRHNAVPVVFGRLLDPFADENPGIVHQDIELAISPHRSVDCGLPVRLTGDIEMDVGGLAARGMNLCFDPAPVLVEHIAEDHLGVLATKELRFRGPLAPGPATDQGHFPIQPAHDDLLLARACAHTLLSACDGPIVARGQTISTLSWQQQDYSSLLPRLVDRYLSLSRLNYRVPRGEDEPSMMEGIADVPHPSAAAYLPEAASVFCGSSAVEPDRDK